MPIHIVRNDITKMNVDVIVNSTNRYLEGRGTGVDGSIHAAAGPLLQIELNDIGWCDVGQAVITKAYDIKQCKYIIHTVGPRFYGWERDEKELLESCYKNIFRLAEEKKCKSIAIPAISSGNRGFPREAAYEIMTSCTREYLSRHGNNIDVFLVLFNNAMVAISEGDGNKVDKYITEKYRRLNIEAIKDYYRYGAEDRSELSSPAGNISVPNHEAQPEYALQDLSFPSMCRWWVKKRGISMNHFYLDSDIAKNTFLNWERNNEVAPLKSTALSCCIGLKLNYEESVDLLKRAGYAISPYFEIDQLIEYFIHTGEYNIYYIKDKVMEETGKPF